MQFSINYPTYDPSMKVILDGNSKIFDFQNMNHTSKPTSWMPVKYGQSMNPWVCAIQFPNTQGNNCGQFKLDPDIDVQKLEYNYSMKNGVKGQNIWEREPKRQIEIQDPSKYRGQLGAQQSSLFKNTDRVFIVNGEVHKADGNFVGAFFYAPIGKTGITIGSYPIYEADVLKLQQAGINAVMDIQTKNQVRMRGINQDKMRIFYDRAQINQYQTFAVSDAIEDEYIKNLFDSAKVLDSLLNDDE